MPAWLTPSLSPTGCLILMDGARLKVILAPSPGRTQDAPPVARDRGGGV